MGIFENIIVLLIWPNVCNVISTELMEESTVHVLFLLRELL